MKNFNIQQRAICPLLFFILCFFKIEAQQQYNLIDNYSFEQYINCPTIAKPTLPTFWNAATINQGIYSNKCVVGLFAGVPKNYNGQYLSYQWPKSGNGYCLFAVIWGGALNERDYVQTKFNTPMLSNKKYYVEYFLNLTDGSRNAVNCVGACINKVPWYRDTINQANRRLYLPGIPQIYNYGKPYITDTMNWVKVSSVFTAKGGEEYIIIGNFNDDAHTDTLSINNPVSNDMIAYQIDDVSVIPLDSFCLKADAGKDTTIKIGDSVFVGSYTNGIDTIKWYNAAGQVIDSVQPGFWVKPITNTYYTLEQQVNGCVSKDTINVLVQPLPLKFTMFYVRCTNVGCGSSPRGNERSVENKWQTANEINVSHFNIQRSIDGIHFETIGKVVAKNNSLNDYNFIHDKLPNTNDQLTIYYRLQSVDNDGRKQYSVIKTLNIIPSTLNFAAYPNPNNGSFVIKLTNEDKGVKEFRLVDMMGKAVWQQKYSFTNADIRVEPNVSKGIYMLQMINNKTGKTYATKIVIN